MSKIRAGAVLSFRLVVIAIAAVAAIACGSRPTVGDQILAQGKDTAAIGTKWNQANQMIADGQGLGVKGQRQIKDGQKMIVDGQDNIRKGDAMVSKGRAMMAEAEAQYRAAQAHPQKVAIPASH